MGTLLARVIDCDKNILLAFDIVSIRMHGVLESLKAGRFSRTQKGRFSGSCWDVFLRFLKPSFWHGRANYYDMRAIYGS